MQRLTVRTFALAILLAAAAVAQEADLTHDTPSDRLKKLLNEGSPAERRRAMHLLADRKEAGVLPTIERIAEAPDTDLVTRHMAVSCIATFRDRAGIPTLLKLLHPEVEADVTLRSYVAECLATWTHQCIPLLAFDPKKDPPEAKKLDDASVNAWMTWWLENREKDEAAWIDTGIDRAIDMLSSPDDFVRGSAIYHLKCQTDEDFDFDPQADPQAREASIARWKRWWEENRKRLRWDAKADRLVTED